LVPWLLSILVAVSLHAAPAIPDNGAAQRDAADLAVFDRKAALCKDLGATAMVVTDGRRRFSRT
jgi:hypothetical protein